MYIVLAVALAGSAAQPDWFLAVGRTQGTHAVQTGYPGAPTDEKPISTRELFADMRLGSGFFSGSVQFPDQPFSGVAMDLKFRFGPLRVGPLRAGIGAQLLEIPRHTYQIPSYAYVRIPSWHDRRWATGVVDLGVGLYDHHYVRALFLYGTVRTPTETDITLFDQPVVLEHQGFGQAPSRMRGFGIEGRLEPIRNGALSGSVIRFDRQPGGGAIVPDSHWVATGMASYKTPWRIGVMVSGTHASDGLGMVFPNDTIQIRLGLAF